MKRYLSLCLMASSLLVAPTAYAAPIFMLQFGSFESQAEAQSKLDALKTKHAGVLSRMQTSVREVRLPPDNSPVYRTQAGPLATRADAQSVCAQMASNGDECYVVETAMEAPSAPPVAVAQQQPTPAPAPSVTPSAMPALSQVPPRDPQNIAAIHSVSDATPLGVVGSTAASDDSADAAGDMDRALAEATQHAPGATAQPSPFTSSAVGVSPATTATHIAEQQNGTPAVPKKGRSLWSRIFGGDDEHAAPAAAAVPATGTLTANDMQAAPVDVVTATPTMPDLPAPTPLTQQIAQQRMAQEQFNQPTPQMQPPLVVSSAPVITQAPSFPLPPPPAPLNGYNAPPPLPNAAAHNAIPQPTGALPDASVRVEEAKRVPLTQATVPVAPQPVPVLPLSLSPSATIGQKTLWAEVGGFADAQSALAFWEQYRSTHPDFPVVRVRVASPLILRQHGNALVNLRVGPFARQGSISNLCNTLAETNEDLRCGYVTDMGISSGAPQPGYLPSSRYKR